MKSVRNIAIFASCLIFTTTLPARENQIQLEIMRPEPGKKSLLKLKLNLEHNLGKNAGFVLVFPEEYDLSSIKIAGSGNMNGGFDLTKSERELTIRRKGGGEAVPAGNEVEIIFGTILVPKSSASKSVGITLDPDNELQKSYQEVISIE